MPKSVRELAVVLILIGGGLIILFSAPRIRGGGPATGIFYALLRPFQQVTTNLQGRISDTWKGYISLVGLRQENRALKEELRRLKGERTDLLNAEVENRRLKKLLNLRTRHDFPSLVAQIIGEDSVGWYRSFFINRGSSDGVASEMAVTAAEGVVGRVTKCAASMAQVLLISDPSLSVDCRLIRTRDRGVLNGSSEGRCVLRYLDLRSDIKSGDEVVTSGLDRIFPKGLPVGKVESVRKGPQGLFLEAHVRPAVDFSEIEEVMIILGRPAGFDLQPGLEKRR